MIDKIDKMSEQTRKKVHGNQRPPQNQYSDKTPTPQTLQILCLRRLGWTVEQVAQTCNVSERAVYKRCSEMKDYFAGLPEIQAAKDAIQCLIPKAVKVYEESLDTVNLRGAPTPLAADIATKILISNKIVADRKTVDEDDDNKPTGELVAEAQRIIAITGKAPDKDTADNQGT